MIEPRVINLIVHGVPVAQPRIRSQVRKSKAGKMFAHHYTPSDADGWKTAIYIAALGKCPTPWLGPVVCNVVLFFPRTKDLLKPKAPAGPVKYCAKPDRDNSDKVVLDALQEAGIFRNDSQVWDGRITKWYAAKGAATGARIEIILEDADGQGQMGLHA